MIIQENVALAPYTTFRIGGTARFFVVCTTLEDVTLAFAYALEHHVPVFILGGGSNVLISDSGFAGLVMKIEIGGIEITNTEVIAGAGVLWDALVEQTVSAQLYGLENLSLIPGTVGASVVQNIGAYGVEVKDTLLWVEIFDPRTQKLQKISNEACAFGYRDSIFKHTYRGCVVVRVCFKLSMQERISIEYKDLKDYFHTHDIPPTLQAVRDAVSAIRRQKLPDVQNVGTAGSFFKNPVITQEQYHTLCTHYPDMPKFSVDATRVKVPAGWILDKICGFKGFQKGAVGVYKNQALVLVNSGGATAQDIQSLAEEMVLCVAQKTGITLEREVEYV